MPKGGVTAPDRNRRPVLRKAGPITALRTAIVFLALSLSLSVSTPFAADSPPSLENRSYVGAVVSGISDAERVQNDLYSTYPGVRIHAVDAESPAHKARLGYDDVITHINGSPIYTRKQFDRAIEEAGIGSAMTLRVLREGEERVIELAAVEWPPGYLGFEVVPICDAGSFRAELPGEIAPLDSLPVVNWTQWQIGELRHAGLKRGSAIVSVNGAAVRSPADLRSVSKAIGVFDVVDLRFYLDGEYHRVCYFAQMSPKAWSGLEIENVTPLLVEVESLTVTTDEAPGLWVSRVEPGSPAEDAGIIPRDFIVSMDGNELHDVREFEDYYANLPLGPDEGVDLAVYREDDDSEMTSRASLTEVGGETSQDATPTSPAKQPDWHPGSKSFTTKLKRSSRLQYVRWRDIYQPLLRITTEVGSGGFASVRFGDQLQLFGDRGVGLDAVMALPHWTKVTGPRWYVGALVRPSSRFPSAGLDFVTDYGQDDEKWHYAAKLFFGRRWLPRIQYLNRPEPFANERISNMAEATLFGFFAGEDNQNYTHVEGIEADWSFRRPEWPGHRLSVSCGFLEHSTMETVSRPSWISGRQSFSENPVEGVATGQINTVSLRYDYDIYNPNRWSGLDLYAYSRFGGGVIGGDHEFAKYGGGMLGSLPLGKRFYSDTEFETGFGTGSIPLQEEFYAGGKRTLPGYEDRQFCGNRLIRFGQRFSLGTEPFGDKSSQAQVRVFAGFNAAIAWDDGSRSGIPNLEWDYVIGTAAPAMFDVTPFGLWFAAARPFDASRGDWRFLVGIAQRM